MSSYERFAYIYDELMNDFDYVNWAKYINEIITKENRVVKNVLEMACGTGSLTKELLKSGYNVDAFDLSVDMLAIARDKLKSHKNCRLFNLDMTKFRINKKYDLVISACDSINYILQEELILEAFKNAYDHLEEEGLFVFDINSYYKLTVVLGNNVFIEDRDDIFYTWDNHLDTDTNIVDFYLTFFVKNESLYNRFDEHHREKAYKYERIMELLHTSGFSDVKAYQGFSFDGVKANTERINFVAKK